MSTRSQSLPSRRLGENKSDLTPIALPEEDTMEEDDTTPRPRRFRSHYPLPGVRAQREDHGTPPTSHGRRANHPYGVHAIWRVGSAPRRAKTR
jgi:hypothetical protein